MRLRIYLPERVMLDEEIRQVTAESPAGEFCLKPRHIDFVTALVPGVLFYLDEREGEHFLAVDGGILVKEQEDVEVATRQAVRGELGELGEVVRKMQEDFREREKAGRTASARLEIGFYRRFLEMSGDR
jgi:F-type H+-transporting ATPase subunit epsilon